MEKEVTTSEEAQEVLDKNNVPVVVSGWVRCFMRNPDSKLIVKGDSAFVYAENGKAEVELHNSDAFVMGRMKCDALCVKVFGRSQPHIEFLELSAQGGALEVNDDSVARIWGGVPLQVKKNGNAKIVRNGTENL